MIPPLNTSSIFSKEDFFEALFNKIELQKQVVKTADIVAPISDTQIKSIKEGETFVADTKNSSCICEIETDNNGGLSLNVKAKLSRYRETSEKIYDIPEITQNATTAKVISFDDESITATIYYEDHETDREFNKNIRDALEEIDLLKNNALFDIVTLKFKGGYQISVQPAKAKISVEDEELFEQFAKMKNYQC